MFIKVSAFEICFAALKSNVLDFNNQLTLKTIEGRDRRAVEIISARLRKRALET